MTTPDWIDEARETLKHCKMACAITHKPTKHSVSVSGCLVLYKTKKGPGQYPAATPCDAVQVALEWLTMTAEAGEAA